MYLNLNVYIFFCPMVVIIIVSYYYLLSNIFLSQGYEINIMSRYVGMLTETKLSIIASYSRFCIFIYFRQELSKENWNR